MEGLADLEDFEEVGGSGDVQEAFAIAGGLADIGGFEEVGGRADLGGVAVLGSFMDDCEKERDWERADECV